MSWASNFEWTHARFYMVPKDTPARLPKGFTWAAYARRGVLGPRQPPVVFRAADWGSEVAPLVRQVLVIAAAASWATAVGKCWPVSERLFVRRPRCIPFSENDQLTINATSSRSGEVLVFPLKEGLLPPKP